MSRKHLSGINMSFRNFGRFFETQKSEISADFLTVTTYPSTFNSSVLQHPVIESRLRTVQKDVRVIEEGKVRNSRDRELRGIRVELEGARTEKEKKKSRLEDIKAFHLLFEECMEWFYKGVNTFSHQPVEQCATLEGICGLEQELDRHLSRCPVQGYVTLDGYGRALPIKSILARVARLKSTFSKFEKIVRDRQDYLRRQKNGLLTRHRNVPTDRESYTGIYMRSASNLSRSALSTQTTQSDPISHLSSFSQTEVSCVCDTERLTNLADRVTVVENKLAIRAKSVQAGDNSKTWLIAIIKRLRNIENRIKLRLVFSGDPVTLMSSPSGSSLFSSKDSTDILSDINGPADSGIQTEEPYHHSGPLSTSSSRQRLLSGSSGRSSSSTGQSDRSDRSGQSRQSDRSDRSGQSGHSGQSDSNRSGSDSSTVIVSRDFITDQDTFTAALEEVERVLLGIEHRVDRLPGSSESVATQTGSSDQGSCGMQTSDSEVSDSSTQSEYSSSDQECQVIPDCRSLATDTGVTMVTTQSQSDPLPQKAQVVQTERTPTRHAPTQCQASAVSVGLQYRTPGREWGSQFSPTLTESHSQHDTVTAQSGVQTPSPTLSSCDSQTSWERMEHCAQTEMIGLFPASCQTDTPHFSAKVCQTEHEVADRGTSAYPDTTDSGVVADIKFTNHKETSADIKSTNHKDVSADIKPQNHKGIVAMVTTKTQGTVARITKMLNRASNTTAKTTRVMEVQVEYHRGVMATDTGDLVVCHEESCQTVSWSGEPLINTPWGSEPLINTPVSGGVNLLSIHR
eukprot:sb/3462223/